MGRVSQPSRHHPGSRSPDIEERDQLFPPRLVGTPKAVESPAAVFGVPLHELERCLPHRKRWRADVDAEHGAEPRVLADALMHHVFMKAPSTRIVLPRPDFEVCVAELS